VVCEERIYPNAIKSAREAMPDLLATDCFNRMHRMGMIKAKASEPRMDANVRE